MVRRSFYNHKSYEHYHKRSIIKTDVKKATEIDTFNLALKSNLAKLKAEVDKINVDKWKTVIVDLKKLSNVVNNNAVKITMYDKLKLRK